jgi:hypothetical protein
MTLETFLASGRAPIPLAATPTPATLPHPQHPPCQRWRGRVPRGIATSRAAHEAKSAADGTLDWMSASKPQAVPSESRPG